MNKKAYVKAFQKELSSRFNTGYQSWWSRFLFHFSDVTNTISILNSGKLYSREKALELGMMHNDNADDEVIGNTTLRAKEYVRFYFGALTPTQFHNEGFKARNTIHNNAHCPMPVFLLFDFVELLAIQDSRFSSGNIASHDVDIYENVEDLNSLEFEYIYHRGYISEDMNARHIVYCRHAEVLIPDEVDIWSILKYVVVRSEAEKQTLLYGLNADIRLKLKEKIRVRTNGLFYADRFYIEKVTLHEDMFYIIFSKPTADKYDFTFKITNHDKNTLYEKEVPQISLESKKATFKIKSKFVSNNISLEIKIDGNIAYAHYFGEELSAVF